MAYLCIKKDMIPKIIHYCWLSDEPFPKKIRKCMETWKKTHPDYEIVRWSTKNFGISSIPYVKEAFEAKKWIYIQGHRPESSWWNPHLPFGNICRQQA